MTAYFFVKVQSSVIQNETQGMRSTEMADTVIEISRGIEEKDMPIHDKM